MISLDRLLINNLKKFFYLVFKITDFESSQISKLKTQLFACFAISMKAKNALYFHFCYIYFIIFKIVKRFLDTLREFIR